MPIDTLGSPDLQIEEQLLQQKAKLAEILTQRGMQPIQVPENTRISPFQGLAQMANAYAGRKMREDSAAGQVALGEKANTRLAEGVQDYFKTRYGSGVTPDPQELSQAADGMSPPPAPATGNPRAAMTQALMSRNPMLQHIGSLDLAHQNELDKPRVANPGDTVVFPGGERPNVTVPYLSKHEIPTDWQRHLPPGAEHRPTDPAGVFRMKGSDGQADVYQLEFDGGKLIGSKRLDNSWNPNAAGNQPNYHFIPTAQGVWAVDSRNPTNKHLLTGADGKPMLAVPADPALAGERERQRAAGHTAGNLTEAQRLALPKTIADAELGLRHIDQMIGSEDGTTKPHEGFSSAVGFTWRPGARFIEGSKEADFMRRLEQVKGGAFLQAYNVLKGGGAITEIEGQKGTQAIQRLAKSQSEAEFIAAAREFQQVLRAGVERAKVMAAQSPQAQGGGSPNVPPPPAGFVVNGGG